MSCITVQYGQICEYWMALLVGQRLLNGSGFEFPHRPYTILSTHFKLTAPQRAADRKKSILLCTFKIRTNISLVQWKKCGRPPFPVCAFKKNNDEDYKTFIRTKLFFKYLAKRTRLAYGCIYYTFQVCPSKA